MLECIQPTQEHLRGRGVEHGEREGKGCGQGSQTHPAVLNSATKVTMHPTQLIRVYFSDSTEYFPLYMQIAWFYFFKTLPCACTFNALANILIVLQDTKHAQIISVAKPAVMTSRRFRWHTSHKSSAEALHFLFNRLLGLVHVQILSSELFLLIWASPSVLQGQ